MFNIIKKLLNKKDDKFVFVYSAYEKRHSKKKVYNNNLIFLDWWACKDGKFWLKMEENGTLTINDKYFSGYGKQYGDYMWRELTN